MLIQIKNTTINYLTANAKAEFRGPGTIKNAVINADGVTFERMPEIQELGEGVKPPLPAGQVVVAAVRIE